MNTNLYIAFYQDQHIPIFVSMLKGVFKGGGYVWPPEGATTIALCHRFCDDDDSRNDRNLSQEDEKTVPRGQKADQRTSTAPLDALTTSP